ncbi:phage gp6-like head-tail connector protein [Stutzerimonas nosocomialis]|uniref:head-tail connector protein n=1 Tax=Stutzerimonas nosocomialis TaxID=1056496 RepID=UPI00110831BD|nr:head-tail connector protein [Stutzerimonas nosocomialis]TLX54872.1 phage gp6-like head-tail connector protein [Stutzerimonas nosocomialis]
MPMPTLADLKTHLRIRHGHEDADLQMKLDAAIDYASQFINRPIPWRDCHGADVDVPSGVRLAILIIAAELYANREESLTGVSYTKIPKAENMLHFYRVGLGV